jgi:hypothetical protein
MMYPPNELLACSATMPQGPEAETLRRFNLASKPFTGSFPLVNTGDFRCHLDTLQADYVFIIAPSLVKSLPTLDAQDASILEEGGRFKIFPNPTAAECSIIFSSAGQYTISILDAIGRKVEEIIVNNEDRHLFETNHLGKGLYHVQVWSETFIGSEKLILE